MSQNIRNHCIGIKQLQNKFAGQIVINKSNLKQLSSDESFHEGPIPDALIRPRSTEEVVEIVKVCVEELGTAAVQMVWSIKNSLDSPSILNPGKIYSSNIIRRQ